VLVGVVALAGCGGADEQVVEVEATPEFVAASARRTTERQTGRFTMQLDQVYEGDAEQSAETTFDGVYDADADLVSGDLHLAVELGPSGRTEGDARTVQDGPDVYLQGFPYDMAPFGLDEDEWVLVELPEEVLEVAGASSESGYVASPAEQLASLREGLSDVEEVGEEDVRDVPTTHLRATYALPEAAREALEQLGPGVEVPTEVPVEVWVDDEGLIRRYESTNEITASSAGSEVTIRTVAVTEYFDFGTEVAIDVPEEATPLAELVPEGGDALGEPGAEETLAELDEQLAELEAESEALLDSLPPDMREIAEAMAELSPEELADDPCQVVEDPDLRLECETYLAPALGGGPPAG
jgi:hypothetical protein